MAAGSTSDDRPEPSKGSLLSSASCRSSESRPRAASSSTASCGLNALSVRASISASRAISASALASILAVVRAESKILAVGAIKRERQVYAEKTARDSGDSFPPETLEVGDVAVLTGHRGHKHSGRLVEALLSQYEGRLFATTFNARIKSTLENEGFIKESR